MFHPYSDLYLKDAQRLLGDSFYYALVVCKVEVSSLESLLSHNNYVKQFERGNPYILGYRSSMEIIEEVAKNIDDKVNLLKCDFIDTSSPEYWTGWTLAYFQWYSAKSFKNIFKRISLNEILSMYNVYHEMDIMRFVEDLNNKYNSIVLETNLKRIRKARGLSQSELAKESCVNKRSIQLYEQRVNDIDKAQAQSLYKLSRALGCDIEDLLENPEL